MWVDSAWTLGEDVAPLRCFCHPCISWRLEGIGRHSWRWLSPWVLLELKMVLKQRRRDLKRQRFLDEVRFVRT